MGRIRVATVINASPTQVWDEVRDLRRHVDWMADAESITFLTEQESGSGTLFDCVTKVGPIRLTDRMTVTEWRDGKSIGVRHEGLVTGTGAFTLARVRRNRTKFTWEEHLTFPWWLGGPVGGVVGGAALRVVWRRNLRALRTLVESGRTR